VRCQLGDDAAMSSEGNGRSSSYGTVAADAPVPRGDVERGFRAVNMGIADLRDDLHRLAAQVVALTEELQRRLDPADAPGLERAVSEATGPTFDKIQAAVEDAASMNRLHLHVIEDKYAIEQVDGPPCTELIPICHGRCCRLIFALSTQDLDEGVVRWDYGRPYMIRQRASDGYCVHSDPTGRGCTVYEQRPAVCRRYDCRSDPRIWADYERRIPASGDATSPLTPNPGERAAPDIDRLAMLAHTRQVALTYEAMSVQNSYGTAEATPGVDSDAARLPSLHPRK
jgi:hypothetical protein